MADTWQDPFAPNQNPWQDPYRQDPFAPTGPGAQPHPGAAPSSRPWHGWGGFWAGPIRSDGDPNRGTQDVPEAEWSALTAALGYDAKQAYLDYRGRGQPHTGWGASGHVAPYQSAQEWVDWQKRAVYGEFAPLADLFANDYAQSTGQPIPPDLLKQITDKLADPNLPEDVKAAWRTALADYLAPPPPPQAGLADQTKSQKYQAWADAKAAAAKTILGTPFLSNMLTDYIRTHPSASSTLADEQAVVINRFKSTLGRIPTADELNRLAGKTDDEVTNYINHQPSRVKGIAYGDLHDAMSRLDDKWLDAYGHKPTDSDYLWSLGKTGEDIQNHIDNSPSHVQGVTIKRYKDLADFADQIKKTTGITSDDQLLGLMNGVSKTGKPGPS